MDQPIWERYKLTEELWREIIVRREVKILSYANFVGLEHGKATETYTGEDIKQVRGVGVILQFKDTKSRVLIPWARVVSFAYHPRDPLMWMQGAGA